MIANILYKKESYSIFLKYIDMIYYIFMNFLFCRFE